MALIIKCRGCRRRLLETETTCPDCGGQSFRFIVDYWPRGRGGGRKQMTLPDAIGTAQEARETERLFLQSEAKRRRIVEEDHKTSTVSDLFDDYLEWYRGHRAATSWRDVSNAWKNDLKRVFGSYAVASLSAEHYSLYQRLRAKEVSNRTVNKELDYFSGFLRWCRREKKIPVARIEYEALPYNRPLPIVLSIEEAGRIMDAAASEPLYHALFLCLYALGLRIAEARGMTWADVDYDNKAVRVRQKGGNWKILPMNDHVVDALKKLAQTYEEKRKGKETKPNPFVFTVRKNAPIQNVRKAIDRICRRAEVTKKVNPHLFRHSIATHLLGAGINLRTIQSYLGHAESSTTEFYTHVDLSHLRNAQDTVGLYKKNE